MKAPKILFAGLLALSTAGAQAQTTLHLTGSTAFRGAVHTAITHMMTNLVYGYTGTSFTGASEAIFNGTVVLTNGTTIPNVTIKTYWTGSLAGIESVSTELPLANAWLTNSTPMSSGGTPNAALTFDPAAVPEICMNDGFQYDSQYPTPALTETEVGTVDFVFAKNVKGYQNAPGLTNMTPILAAALWKSQVGLPLSMWTGNVADEATTVYALGRDPDSGTRKDAFLETGIQNFNGSSTPTFTTINQWEPLDASGNQVNGNNKVAIASQIPWPPTTNLDGFNFPQFDGGYHSGGDLAAAMSQSSPYIYVSYLGLSDDATLTNAAGSTAVNLSYNGVPFSHAAVTNGQYTYWTYEFLGYYPPYAGTVAHAEDVANTLAVKISTEISLPSYGDYLTNMNVYRNQEGQAVYPLY